jgi:hypothetical protein
MSDLGDLFGGIGEFFGGLAEAGAEAGGERFVENAVGEAAGNGEPMDAAVDRYLTGGPRMLNVNDI